MRLNAQTRTELLGVSVTVFVMVSLAIALDLMKAVQLDTLAKPTAVCKEEIEWVAVIFLASLAVMQPIKDAIGRNRSSVASAMRREFRVPGLVRVASLLLFAFGLFCFTFWTTADVLGGYNGYNYSFSTYPVLSVIYHHSIALIPYLNERDKGTQASFYFTLAIIGLVGLRLNRGIWTAIKDVVTLFAAPCLVVFELALWYFAPEDMTWHVTDYLYIGGPNDGGYRALDGTNWGNFLVSNWLVLFIVLCLVAYRIPWLSLPSKFLWRRRTAENPPIAEPAQLDGQQQVRS